MYQHLLVPLDGSELSSRAVQASLALAQKLGASVTGLVCEPLAPLPTVGMHLSAYERSAGQFMQQTQAHAEHVLDEFEAAARALGVAFRRVTARSDDVDESIVETARTQGCDLIVMVTHGRGMFGEFLFGSHTKSVMSLSKLPLLVLQ